MEQAEATEVKKVLVADLKVGQVWRARKPGRIADGFRGFVNDRAIIWIGQEELQYDSPAVASASRYPRVTREKFAAWAGEQVDPKSLPENSWADWDDYKKAAR